MAYPTQAPWTGIGSLQSDVSSLKQELSRKAESYELHSINRRLDHLEHSMREIRSMLDSLRNRIETLETH